VTEEISDPWERQKVKHDTEEDKHKNKKRTKFNKNQGGSHKDMHSTSSSIDDDTHEEKPPPPGFTTVENKTKTNKNKRMEYSGHGHMDRLDEISLNGPRPDTAKEYPVKRYSKFENGNKSSNNNKKNKKTPFHHEKERMMMDTPTSPHAIAAAIVEAALHKSQQKKKSAGKYGLNSYKFT